MNPNLEFDYLCKLYKSDPEKFEALRKQEIESFISSAPESSQKRLRGLQFQVDAKREIYKNAPFKACIEISKMMHESFAELRYQLNLCAGKESPLYDTQLVSEQPSQYSENTNILQFQR